VAIYNFTSKDAENSSAKLPRDGKMDYFSLTTNASEIYWEGERI
jgi:hypothetical protein